ncbi:unnamed protein product, partial [Laminaria digitata]
MQQITRLPPGNMSELRTSYRSENRSALKEVDHGVRNDDLSDVCWTAPFAESLFTLLMVLGELGGGRVSLLLLGRGTSTGSWLRRNRRLLLREDESRRAVVGMLCNKHARRKNTLAQEKTSGVQFATSEKGCSGGYQKVAQRTARPREAKTAGAGRWGVCVYSKKKCSGHPPLTWVPVVSHPRLARATIGHALYDRACLNSTFSPIFSDRRGSCVEELSNYPISLKSIFSLSKRFSFNTYIGQMGLGAGGGQFLFFRTPHSPFSSTR